MFPPFPCEQAHQKNLELISLLEKGEAKLLQLTKESEERKGHGLMLGTLICKKVETGEEVILHAVSGISMQLQLPSSSQPQIVVPPLASPSQIEAALAANDAAIHELTARINAGEKELSAARTALTTQSLQRVFDLYTFTRFDGKKISLNEIIARHGGRLPPTGTGDCCAPKLLSYAFENNLIPFSMDEVFYGKDSPNKKCGSSYPPCDERCGYILPSILGLEILYRDDAILVVNKQSGLLSVPGRTPDKQDCIESRMKALFPFTNQLNQPAVHRLDMETSGIMILAFTKEAHRELNRQFEAKEVHKKYIALLDGVLQKADGEAAPKQGEKTGRIELKFRLDPDNRPHQIYDEEFGKLGITDWENLGQVTYRAPDGSTKKATRVLFIPQTGRTHQLRLHSSDIHGFHLPIIGDTLYGTCLPGERLMLHAQEITFTHPTTHEKMHFICQPEF
ncbi:Pseudouridylate synthase, 23S RNA-specific [Treponema sp. JC4]|uniref:RluA family pseudouridine synthase n=1 Tax=Treponema sp. JC4 TaxID=1124982 RepID=UPI00025B0225|nr:RluA family pseudouridine synthase [Treponema sp. JC4]EID86108.1 Pseudouridylate synthase, 23S RNA-specific [Treponema sp. JC4]